MKIILNALARFIARPAVTDWLIQRAAATPYSHIYDQDGSTYMERYWLFNPYENERRWLPSVRLHHIMRADHDRHKHDHPWDARTFILRGWYTEKRPCSRTDEYPYDDDYYSRGAGTTARLRFGEYHTIDQVSPGGVWTLFVTFKYRGTWGFLVNGVKIPWRKYLNVE